MRKVHSRRRVLDPGSRRRPERLPEAEIRLLEDLALVLSRDNSLYLRLGPEGAVMAVKSSERTFAIGDVIETRWRSMTPEERGEATLGWIRKAADYCRNPRIRWGAYQAPPD